MPQQKINSYTVKFIPDGEGGFIARVPALPAIVTGGPTMPEAMAMAADAIDCYLGYLDQEGKPWPPDVRCKAIAEPTFQKVPIGGAKLPSV